MNGWRILEFISFVFGLRRVRISEREGKQFEEVRYTYTKCL